MADPEHEVKRQKKKLPNAHATTLKQKRQLRNRRSKTLIKKAYELSAMVDADVFLGIRDRATERIKTFCADKSGIWSSQMSHLDSYYPIPERKTPEDFSSQKITKTATSTTKHALESPSSELRSISSAKPSDISKSS